MPDKAKPIEKAPIIIASPKLSANPAARNAKESDRAKFAPFTLNFANRFDICFESNMTFNTRPSMRRHQLHYCKYNETSLQNELNKEKITKINKKDQLYSEIKHLVPFSKLLE